MPDCEKKGPAFSFMPAVNNLTNELLEAEKSHRRLERELGALRKRLGATLMLRNTLQEWEYPLCAHTWLQHNKTDSVPHLCCFFRDINKTVKLQAVESAKAEERLLNMDFVTAKAKELVNRRERAEVCCAIRSGGNVELPSSWRWWVVHKILLTATRWQ